MSPGGCDACDWPGQAKALGDAIAVWAPTKSTSVSPVSVVDCWTGFVAADFTDGVHMTSTGLDKLAKCWFQPVKDAVLAFGGGVVTSVLPSTTTTLSTTSVRPSTTSSSSLVVVTTTSSRVSTTLSTTALRTSTTLSTTSRATTVSTTTAASGGAGSPLYGQCGK